MHRATWAGWTTARLGGLGTDFSQLLRRVIRALKRPAGIDIVRLVSIDSWHAQRAGEENMAGTSLRRWLEGLKGPAFTAREIRVICAMFLCIAPVALGLVLVFGRDLFPTLHVAGLGGDYPQFFMSGWLLNHYPPSRLYDLQLAAAVAPRHQARGSTG